MLFTTYLAFGQTQCVLTSEPFSDTCNFQKGLVFLKERDIILSTDVWTVVVSINTEDYDQILLHVEAMFQYLESDNITSEMRDLIPFYEINQLRSSVQITKQEIESIKLLLPASRNRRGLVNGVGTAFKFLFGVMDDDDLQVLNERISNLEEESKTLVHVEDEKLTYIKRLTNEVDDNSKAIKQLASILKSTIEEIKVTNFSIWTEIIQVKRKLQYQVRVSSLFREVEMTLHLVNKQLIQMQEALDVTATGHLSSILLTPAKLYEILKEIVQKLPNGLSLITDVDLDKVYNYYRMAKVNAVSIKNSVRLIIELPLQSPDKHFELFSVKSLPYYDETLMQFIIVEGEASNFAITEDRQYHVTLDDYQLTACSQPPYEVCPIRTPLLPAAESNSCLHAMFIGDDTKAQKFCRRAVVPHYTSPTVYQGPGGNYWIYSVHEITRVTWRCSYANNTAINKSTTKLINGTGVFSNTRRCYIFSKHFTLLPHSKGQMYFKVPANPIVTPAIKELFSPLELLTLQDQPNEPTSDNKLSTLQNIINSNADRVNTISIDELHRKLTTMRKTKAVTQNDTLLTYLIVIFIVILITSCVTIICVLHYVNTNRPRRRHVQPQPQEDLESEHRMSTAIHVYDLAPNAATTETTRFAQGQLTTFT